MRKKRFELDGMTQDELAIKSGLSRQTILCVENGKVEPNIRNTIAILDALNLGLYVGEKGGEQYSLRPL